MLKDSTKSLTQKQDLIGELFQPAGLNKNDTASTLTGTAVQGGAGPTGTDSSAAPAATDSGTPAKFKLMVF